MAHPNQADFITFGKKANCTLELCPIEWSVYQYQPSIPANAVFVAIFGLLALIHAYLGVRWKTHGFAASVVVGCLVEIAGYAGRLVLHNNPWSFTGFMIQIVLITTAPVFFTAAIYFTLSKMINHYAPRLSRFPPKLFYWIFLPTDVICLIFQAVGGALSASSAGSSSKGVVVALVGLGLQVLALLVFFALFLDFLIRYLGSNPKDGSSGKLRLFFSCVTIATVFILGRCAYRCYELSQGYRNSTVITDEGLFIGLEGVLVVLAVCALCVGHPGLLLSDQIDSIAAEDSAAKAATA